MLIERRLYRFGDFGVTRTTFDSAQVHAKIGLSVLIWIFSLPCRRCVLLVQGCSGNRRSA
jgi:hypothetical protein